MRIPARIVMPQSLSRERVEVGETIVGEPTGLVISTMVASLVSAGDSPTLSGVNEPTPPEVTSRIPPWTWRAIFAFWGVFALLVVGRSVATRMRSLLIMLLISLFLALAIEPAVNWMARRGIRRGVATAIMVFGITLLTAVFVGAIGTLLARQVGNLVDKAPDYVRQIQDWVNRTFNAKVDAKAFIDRLTSADGPWKNLASDTLSLSATFLNVLFQALGVGLFTFYLVADGPKFRRAICSRLRPSMQSTVLQAWEVAIEKTGGYIYSRGLLAFFSGVTHAVFMAIIGVPNAVALGVWVGLISQFLPVVGTYLAGLLPVLVAVIDEPAHGVWMLGFVVLYQQLENYLLLPRITARTMDLHPAIAFGSAIAGGAILGPVGAILALPVAASLQAFATMYGARHDVVESPLTALPGSTSAKDSEPSAEPEPAVDS
jgi:predicted PurR-regulated permease PerM